MLGAFLVGIIFIPEESTLLDEANDHPPHKIDENMWKNRENVEEILFLLEKPRWPQEVRFIGQSWLGRHIYYSLKS